MVFLPSTATGAVLLFAVLIATGVSSAEAGRFPLAVSSTGQSSAPGPDPDDGIATLPGTSNNTDEAAASPFVAPNRGFTVDHNGKFVILDRFQPADGQGGAAGFQYGANPTTGEGNFPAIDGMDFSIVTGVIDPCSGTHPHIHDNAIRWGTMVKGSLELYIYSEVDAKLYGSTVTVGQSYVIPQGAVHFFKNLGPDQAVIMGGSSAALQTTTFVDLEDYSSYFDLASPDQQDPDTFFMKLSPESCYPPAPAT